MKPYLELRLGKAFEGWTASGSDFVRTMTAAELTFAGVIRPIVGAESLIFPRQLTRVERTADLVAGTWYFDDAALVAGGTSDMYVRLPTATDPDATTAGLVVHMLFTFGAGGEPGEVHPLLGDNKYLNPGFEAWSGGNPTSWTEHGAGAVQETSIVLDGSSSAEIGSATITAGALDGVGQARVGVQHAPYRVSGYYQTPTTGQSSAVEVRLRVGDGTNWLLSDGRTLTTVDGGFRLADTYGETRRFLFDFVWSGATTASLQADLLLYNTSASSAAGTLYADKMAFKRIQRWCLYEPRLDASSIPEMEIRALGINFGPTSIGIGSVSVLDGDGALAEAFAGLLLVNRTAKVLIGGETEAGEEIHRDEWWPAFTGIIRQPVFEDGRITFELDTAHTLTRMGAPQNAYNISSFSTMARSQEGLPKPLIFGIPWETGGATFQHIIPGVRVTTTANGYGAYEYLDPLVPVRDGVNVDLPASYSIKVYPNKDLADRNLQGYAITDSTNDFAVSNNNTRWTVLRDIRNYRYDKSGNDVGTGCAFVFDTELSGSAADLTASIDISGPAYKVAADLQAAMRTAVGGGDTATTVTYSESTHKFTVARSGGGAALNLYMTAAAGTADTDAAVHRESWKLLGFDTRSDKTGSTTYTSDVATFSDPDVDHIIRFPGGGYKDDATGSVCGTANAAINTPAAVAAWLLRHVLNIPPANIDVDSFAAGRTQNLADFSLQFRELDASRAQEVLGDLCLAGLFDLNVSGDGVWKCKVYTAGSTGATEIYEHDILPGFRMWRDASGVYKDVRLYGDWNPSLKRHMTYGDGAAVIDPYIPIKYGEERILELFASIERQYITGGTQLLSNYYGRLIGKVPRLVQFSVKGKLLTKLIGDKVRITRSRAFDTTGALASSAFRIIGLRHNFIQGISTCTAVEDVVFLT